MAKGQALTTKNLQTVGAVEAPETKNEVRGPKRTDGMVRLQHMKTGTVSFGGSSSKSANGRRTTYAPAYKWSGVHVQTVPLEVAREILCRFRDRFRALDPM